MELGIETSPQPQARALGAPRVVPALPQTSAHLRR